MNPRSLRLHIFPCILVLSADEPYVVEPKPEADSIEVPPSGGERVRDPRYFLVNPLERHDVLPARHPDGQASTNVALTSHEGT